VKIRHKLSPHTVHDLRGKTVERVHYPADAVLVIAGIPGAGKSTLLHRLFDTRHEALRPAPGPEGAAILDSHQVRTWWRRWLGHLPYPLWRPIVHLTYYQLIWTAITTVPGPVIVHECGTRRLTRRLIRRWAASHRRALHLLLLDVEPAAALAGQRTRQRSTPPRSFTAHCRRWKHLITGINGGQPPTGMASIVIIDRPAADGLHRIDFGPRPAPPNGVQSRQGTPRT
jgi:hypothetical protein